MALSLVNNGDSGLLARTKINDAIDAMNNFTSTTTTTTTLSPVFTMTIDTNYGGDGFLVGIPYEPSGTYTGTIDWGDATITANSFADRTHVYATAGIYTIRIDGQITGFNFYYYGGTLSTVLTSITNFGNQFSFGTNLDYAFYNCSILTSVPNNIPLSGDITGMFINNNALSVDISGWDVSTVNNMNSLFTNCTLFNSNLSAWNVSNVTAAPGMFTGCTSFSSTNLDALYNGWASLPALQNGVYFEAPVTCHTSASDAARAILTGTYSWTVVDAGVCP